MLLLPLLAIPLPAFLQPVPQAPIRLQSPPAAATGALEKLPLCFVENQGQVDDARVAYYLPGEDRTLYFTPDGVTLALADREGGVGSRWVARLEFLGADPDVRPVAGDRRQAVFSYFRGRPEDWRTAVPAFGRLVYRNLWPGIDLVYSGTAGALKYEFVIQPGADPEQIRLAWRGVSGLSVDEGNTLHVETPAGNFADGAPVAWQEIQGRRRPVAVRYALAQGGAAGAIPYHFQVGAYDPSETLILDPVLLVYCGYIGGDSSDYGRAIAVDDQGRIYVTGETGSTELSFPVAVGPDLTQNGGFDAFVARVNAAGTALEYCGYIGGGASDYGQGIAVDAQGNAYVCGYTDSDESSFPVLVGPDLTHNGGFDAFVARVNAAGTALDYCGYLGGVATDEAWAIAVDAAGRSFLTGITGSDAGSFPVLVGPDLTHNGGNDAFVARVNASGTALDYCGYLGGAAWDGGAGIAIDGLGRACVGGSTDSDETSFPVAVGPDLAYNGGRDAFVARVNTSGTALEFCGYVGGSGWDEVLGIAVDGLDRPWLAGDTGSDETSFPVSVGPDLAFNGGIDAFVARVQSSGAGLDLCGYVGGSGYEYGWGIAVDQAGNAYIAGETTSDEGSFPILLGPDLSHNGWEDAFVARVGAASGALDYCGYIGGGDSDHGYGIAVDRDGRAFVVGDSFSDETTFPVITGPDLTHNGGWNDVFVARVDAFLLTLAVSPDPLLAGQVATFTVTGGMPGTAAWLGYSLLGLGTTPVPQLGITLDLAGPVQAAGPTGTNAQGAVSWTLPIPPQAAGLAVWVQAAQVGRTSNVVRTHVQ